MRAAPASHTGRALEAYAQEAGRGGRDGKPARCVLLFSPDDVAIQEYFLSGTYPTKRQVRQVFEALEVHVDAIARAVRTVGVVILRGAGGNFSSGYDMQEVLAYVRAHAKPHFNSEVIEKVANLPQPVISAIQGH